MPACRCATFVCTAIFFTAASSRSDGVPDPREAIPAEMAGAAALVTAPPARGPVLRQGLAKGVTARLAKAVPVALRRLREHPSCRALFADLGSDGVAEVSRASYDSASAQQERRYCRQGTFAITTVRGSVVVLCRSFAHLSDERAATILIHEALHLAGQGESPSDSDAPDAVAISRMVMRSCWLF